MFSKSIKTLLIIAGCSMALSAHAKLTITNNTKLDSTSIIEDGMCSADLPGGTGVTKAGTTNEISDFIIGLACWNHPICKAEVYMDAKCTGPHIATVFFDTGSGDITYTMLPEGDGYQLLTDKFAVTLNGGPQLANKLFN